MGFNLHVKIAEIRDEIQPDVQSPKSGGIGICRSQLPVKRHYMGSYNSHSVPEGGKEDIMFINSIKGNNESSPFGPT